MVDARRISPEAFRARRILSGHKQESLARALGCSRATVSNFERKRVDSLYSVRWDDLARELGLDKVA
jgi:transcriptional regulator with XRE-family HTH domain